MPKTRANAFQISDEEMRPRLRKYIVLMVQAAFEHRYRDHLGLPEGVAESRRGPGPIPTVALADLKDPGFERYYNQLSLTQLLEVALREAANLVRTAPMGRIEFDRFLTPRDEVDPEAVQ